MVRFNTKRIQKDAQADFERTWIETSEQLPRNTSVRIRSQGSTNPLRETVQKCREALIEIGFQEYENQTILPASDVYLQYGPEAPVILDRAFYLATLPRPELGLSADKIGLTEGIIGRFDQSTLQEILRSYKKGEIEGDDFVETLVKRLSIDTGKATAIIERVFPELKEIAPVPTEMTLRSHMTATWYHTLAAMQNKTHFPLAMFAVGPRYRNEQREDKGHLRVHNSASMVVMDPNMSLEAGKELTLEFLVKMGFSDARFDVKAGTSKYYAHQQEQEVFAKWHGEWLEIGDIGMYSPISLANFGITSPVFNGGFGVERMAMIFGRYRDIREMVYPQFHSSRYDDEDIAKSLSVIKEPKSERGKDIARGIEDVARKNYDAMAPVRLIAYEDECLRVEVLEEEEGQKLLGPAGLNNVYVQDGSILSTPNSIDNAVTTVLQSSSLGIASDIEQDLETGKESGTYRVRMAKNLSDVNLRLPTAVHNYIVGEHKGIRVKGPVFLTVEYTVKNLTEVIEG
ncbi:O-phosphoserine--tRNA ligase [Candidatus Woesearchaeota archaeon CG_4_10_14_0_2_um_filter_33_13]|nr:MAG: O-phosphoserine--tRNA ligase [Candidatus Woesearchaeota archaeon CG_4_10_14_0_2_um_filter_33_13]